MVRHFDAELQDLRDGLMAMAGQVEEMIDLSRADREVLCALGYIPC